MDLRKAWVCGSTSVLSLQLVTLISTRLISTRVTFQKQYRFSFSFCIIREDKFCHRGGNCGLLCCIGIALCSPSKPPVNTTAGNWKRVGWKSHCRSSCESLKRHACMYVHLCVHMCAYTHECIPHTVRCDYTQKDVGLVTFLSLHTAGCLQLCLFSWSFPFVGGLTEQRPPTCHCFSFFFVFLPLHKLWVHLHFSISELVPQVAGGFKQVVPDGPSHLGLDQGFIRATCVYTKLLGHKWWWWWGVYKQLKGKLLLDSMHVK